MSYLLGVLVFPAITATHGVRERNFQLLLPGNYIIRETVSVHFLSYLFCQRLLQTKPITWHQFLSSQRPGNKHNDIRPLWSQHGNTDSPITWHGVFHVLRLAKCDLLLFYLGYGTCIQQTGRKGNTERRDGKNTLLTHARCGHVLRRLLSQDKREK